MAATKTVKKTTNTNIKEKPERKVVVDFYEDIFTFRQMPASLAFIERLSEDLIKWATTNKNALKITQFTRDRGIHTKTFQRWANKYDVLGKARIVAKEAIGDRREIGAINNKYNTNMIISQMPKYDDTWMKLEEDRAELKARLHQKHDGDAKYTIVLDKYCEKENGKETDNMPS